MRKLFLFPILLFVFLFLAGCGGFRSDIGECHAMFDPGNRALCLRELAISKAAQLECSDAAAACDNLHSMAGVFAGDANYYLTQSDQCYYDIAKMMNDEGLCNKIGEGQAWDILGGSTITRTLCVEEIEHLRKSHPAGANVMSNCVDECATNPSKCGTGYVCPLIFLFPLVLVPALLRFKK